MHDFILAKEIISELERIAQKKGILKIKKAYLEIGKITLAHDNFPNHIEEINLENLSFGLKSLSKSPVLKETEFIIQSATGSSWKIGKIEVE